MLAGAGRWASDCIISVRQNISTMKTPSANLPPSNDNASAAGESPTLVVLLLLPLVDVQRQLLHPHPLLLLGLLLVEVVGGQVGGQRHVEDLILMSQTRAMLLAQLGP